MSQTDWLLALLCGIVALGQYKNYQLQKEVAHFLLKELPKVISTGIITASRKEEALEIQASITDVPLRALKGLGEYGENSWES